MLRIKQFFTLALLTALEVIRRPICLLLTTACVVLSVLTPLLLMHQFGEEGKLARDSALAFHFVIGLFVAGHAASSVLSREVNSGTASAVLSKPVRRELFFLAKFAGITLVVIAFSFCATLTTLMSERIARKFYFTDRFAGYVTDWKTAIFALSAPVLAYAVAAVVNYRKKRPFQSNAFWMAAAFLGAAFIACGFFNRMGSFDPFDFRMNWQLIPASALITMALVVLSAIALTLSIRFNAVPALTLTLCVLAAGLVSDFLLGRKAADSAVIALIYGVIPDWQHFWVPDTLSRGGAVPLSYLVTAGTYALACSAAVLCLGTALFRHRETN
ncbi:MAG: ABC transporter permease [Kiritimatiellia bacterium]